MPLIVGQDLSYEAPKRRLMMRVAEMAELVNHDVFEDLGRGQDQAPVEIDHALRRTAAPQPLLRFDAKRRRHQTVPAAVMFDHAAHCDVGLPLEPGGERRLDHHRSFRFRHALFGPNKRNNIVFSCQIATYGGPYGAACPDDG